MRNVLPPSALLALLCLASCSTPYSKPHLTAPPGHEELASRVEQQLRDLEGATTRRYKGKSIEIKQPVEARYADWRGMPVAKIRGRYQGGLTSWKVMEGHATVYFAQAKGKIPEWLVRHEALHVILLSNGVPGHPRSFSKHFEKPYWWMPEGTLRRGAFNGDKEIDTTSASCAAACPICGVPVGELREIE